MEENVQQFWQKWANEPKEKKSMLNRPVETQYYTKEEMILRKQTVLQVANILYKENETVVETLFGFYSELYAKIPLVLQDLDYLKAFQLEKFTENRKRFTENDVEA